MNFRTNKNEWIIKPELSKIKFSYNGLFAATGSLSGIKGDVLFDPQKLEESSFNISLDAKTVDTNNGLRDKHFKEEGYFDVIKYPLIKVTSKNITKGENYFYAISELQIKNISKKVEIPFIFVRSGNAGSFKGGFKLNRSDFDLGGTTVAAKNEVRVEFEIIANSL